MKILELDENNLLVEFDRLKKCPFKIYVMIIVR
jgi:hypothetical protein